MGQSPRMSQTQLTKNVAREAGQKLTLTQAEGLRIGQRGQYLPSNTSGIFAARLMKHCITCWIDKRRKTPSESDKALREFIDLPYGYELIYGITYKGVDYDCGDIPRDLGRVVQGIDIASGI